MLSFTVHCKLCADAFPERCEAFGVYRAAIALAVDAEQFADELEDLVNKAVEEVGAVAGAFAIFHAYVQIAVAIIADIVAVCVNVIEFAALVGNGVDLTAAVVAMGGFGAVCFTTCIVVGYILGEGVTESIDRYGFSADFFAADIAVNNKVIGAFVFAISFNFIFLDSCERSMFKSRDFVFVCCTATVVAVRYFLTCLFALCFFGYFVLCEGVLECCAFDFSFVCFSAEPAGACFNCIFATLCR